ncbi:UNKNOWN [Stylonychia lemnae]|uniref:Phospholipid scramblase n=1 Tax=Stylonychia lemnae TaxID=5949 RepID=A0A077ZSX8_STYLE|nr:UNKNOWN [Stylonychia lemnae]|eukprot:CDW72659.1 UNKNOWN [Stylonychia lemnae]
MPMRCFVPSSCRGYECQFQAENNRRVIFSMSRPAKCTMLCISRPEISVYYLNAQKQKQLLKNEDQSEMVELDQFQDHLKSYQEEKEGKRELIGRAYLPFSFCGTSIIIYDENNLPIYQIFGTSWQCQLFFFPTPCGPCRDSVWIIADFKSTIEDPIGHIYKRWSNCFKQCMSTAPWYVIDFPENIDWKRKLLILSAVQLLDQHYFSGTCK